jgi:hypothetical protein
MKRTIQFWYLVNPDKTPLAAQFPYSKLQRELLAAQERGQDTTVTLEDGTELHLSAIRPTAANAEPFFVLYRRRTKNPSHMSDAGVMKPLPFQEGQKQEEPTYLKFFPRNIVGFLMHGDSPRPRRLVDYLSHRFKSVFGLQPILRGDLDAAIRELTAQHIEIAIPSQQAAHVAAGAAEGFATGLGALAQLLQDGAITLRLSPGRGGNALRKARRREEIKALAQNLVRWAKQSGATRAALVAKDVHDDSVTLNLLDQRFAYKVSVAADEFEYGQTEIRDDTVLIQQHWNTERGDLEPLAPQPASDEQDEGLLRSLDEPGT